MKVCAMKIAKITKKISVSGIQIIVKIEFRFETIMTKCDGDIGPEATYPFNSL